MARGRAHPPRVRKNAEALLLAGHTQAEVCELTGLDSGLISRWAARLDLQEVAAQKSQSAADLLMDYFRAALRAMKNQAEVLGDPEYCRTHDPHRLAIAHGVIGDKLAGIATTAQALGIIGHQATEPALPSPAVDDGG
jgi:hypothetical protein